MIKKILALLETRFPGARKDVLTNLASVIALQCDTEDKATEIVGKLTADKVTKHEQDYRSSIDREVQQANRTLETNLRNKYDFKEKGKQDPPVEPGVLTLDQIKAIMAEQLNPLKERLDAAEKSKLNNSRRETYVGKLKAAKLSESLIETMAGQFDRMSFKDDADFEAYLTASQPGIDKLAQQAADDALRANPRPNFGKTNEDGVSSSVAAYVAAKKATEQNLTGKQV